MYAPPFHLGIPALCHMSLSVLCPTPYPHLAPPLIPTPYPHLAPPLIPTPYPHPLSPPGPTPYPHLAPPLIPTSSHPLSPPRPTPYPHLAPPLIPTLPHPLSPPRPTPHLVCMHWRFNTTPFRRLSNSVAWIGEVSSSSPLSSNGSGLLPTTTKLMMGWVSGYSVRETNDASPVVPSWKS